jgi:hypothetical protein
MSIAECLCCVGFVVIREGIQSEIGYMYRLGVAPTEEKLVQQAERV